MARRVLTEAGAKYFGKPIGSFISPDEEDDAKAKHGGRPAPPQSVTGSNQKRAGTSDGTNPPKTFAQEETPPAKNTKTASSSQNTGLVKSTLSGPQKVSVGSTTYNIPEGSSIFKSPSHSGRVYIVTPEGNAHVFTSGGELNLTPEQRKNLATQISESLSPTTVESEDEEEDVTWVRLLSIARQLAQAEKAGDDSQVKKLEKEFREGLSSYNPEADPRKVRNEITKTTGQKK